MENVKEYRLKENIKVKLYSDVEVYKQMFYLLLTKRIQESQMELEEETYITFEEAVNNLKRKYRL